MPVGQPTSSTPTYLGRVITCDPTQRIVEVVLNASGQRLQIMTTPVCARWPMVGETWTVCFINNTPYLGEPYQTYQAGLSSLQTGIEEIPPGDAWINSPTGTVHVIGSSDGHSDFAFTKDSFTLDSPPPSGGDDTALLASLIGSGRSVRLQAGNYRCSGRLTFDDMIGVRIHGVGGTSAGAAPGTTITYTGTAASFISARSINGFDITDVQVLYSNASFTGMMFDFSHSTGLATDANNIVFERVGLGGAGIRTAAIGVSLDNAIIATFRDTDFYNLTTAVRGRSISGNYSNVVKFEGNCTFAAILAAPILNPGQAWSIHGATFEGLVTSGGVQAGAGAVSSSFSGIVGLDIRGCWFGDANATGIWIDCAPSGAAIMGNYISTGATGINVQASSSGVVIAANDFDTMNVGIGIGAGCSGMDVRPNNYRSVAQPVSYAALPTQSFYGDGTGRIMASQLWGRDGLATLTANTTGLTSAQIDALFAQTPLDGMMLVDTTNNIFLQRSGGKWYKSAALTLIP